MTRFAFVLACLAGCYHPDFHDCAVSCESGNGCPDGLSCDMASKLCTTKGTSCQGGGGDAGGDTGGSNSCDWPITATNYDPCAASFPATIGSISVENSDISQDSTSAACTYMFGGHEYCLLHVTSMHVATGHAFQPKGPRPMIIVSDGDIIIDGTVNASFQAGDACPGLDGVMGSQYGGGGAGGGGYTGGGNGGRGDQGGTLGGVADPDTMLSPLTPGCPGGAGGVSTGLSPAPGGVGGGAIELASRTAIHINGGAQVISDGGGGSPGNRNSTHATGGGGGGTGGKILLEAPLVLVDSQAVVCAVGGGGGTGASFMTNVAARGLDGTGCTGGTGGTVSGVQSGGNGGDFNPPTAGGDTQGGFAGGGGGGAGGRIRINATTHQTGINIVPPPTF
jgi:hypothetical protein